MYESDSTTFAQRVTLCCLVDLTEADRTPVDATEVKAAAKRLLESVDGQPVGGLSEADVVRALSELAGTELIDERRPEDRSPVGKGRPKYALDVDADELRASLTDDDEVGSILG